MQSLPTTGISMHVQSIMWKFQGHATALAHNICSSIYTDGDVDLAHIQLLCGSAQHTLFPSFPTPVPTQLFIQPVRPWSKLKQQSI